MSISSRQINANAPFCKRSRARRRRPRLSIAADFEKILPGLNEKIEAVSARALAPLDALVRYAEKFIDQGAVGVFPKGKLFEAELTGSLLASKYLITTTQSQTSPAARLVLVSRRAKDSGQVD